MRRVLFVGSALLALIVIAASVGRVLHVVSLFAPTSGDELAAQPANGPASSPASPPEIAGARAEEVAVDTADRTRLLSEGLGDALRSARATGEQSGRSEPRGPQGALALATRDTNVGIAIAETKPDLAGAQVEDLARKVAPALAREALAPSADDGTRNADVERALLETWTQQNQILAGRQGTMDTELKDISP
jgi:hypothetical protein